LLGGATFAGTGVTLLVGIGLSSTGKGENTGTEKRAVDTNICRILKNRKEDGNYGSMESFVVTTKLIEEFNGK